MSSAGKEPRAMVRSLWCSALAVMFMGIGWAWSQTPSVPSPMPSSLSGRIMVVRDSGHTLRCRVLVDWRLKDGTKAYELEVVDSGEKLTIVEEGAATTVPGNRPGSQVRALP